MFKDSRNVTIFAIDYGRDFRATMRFMRYVDQLVAVNEIPYCAKCIGAWDGSFEDSYMMPSEAFDKYIADSGWVINQVCVLRVPADTNQPAHLEYLASGRTESVGKLREITSEEAKTLNAWTYVQRTDKYYTTTAD